MLFNFKRPFNQLYHQKHNRYSYLRLSYIKACVIRRRWFENMDRNGIMEWVAGAGKKLELPSITLKIDERAFVFVRDLMAFLAGEKQRPAKVNLMTYDCYRTLSARLNIGSC